MATNDFKFAELKEENSDVIQTKFVSTKKEITNRFISNKLAMTGAILFFLLIIISIIVMFLPNYDTGTPNSSLMDMKPSAEHWFGTDSTGRDLWSRNWAAIQYSFSIALIATTINIMIAILIGLLMGYFEEFDRIFSGVIKIMYAMPTIIVLILFSIVFYTKDPIKSFMVIILSLTFSGWVNASQQVRGSVKKTRNLEFITASQTLGTSRVKMLGVLFTYALPIVIVQYAIIFPRMIIAEATLGFLGLSIPDVPTLGNLINDARNSFLAYPYQLLFPLIMLALTTISIQFMGFGLEDAILGKDGA